MLSSTLSAKARAVGAEQRIAHPKQSETAGRAAASDADRCDRQARVERAEKALIDARQRIDELLRDADALRRRATEAERRAEDIAADRQVANMMIEAMRGVQENLHRDVTAAEAVAADACASLDAAHRQARDAQAAAEAAQIAHVEMATEAAKLRADVEAAHRLTRIAQARAERLWQDERARRCLGRWTRLRAAWRGE